MYANYFIPVSVVESQHKHTTFEVLISHLYQILTSLKTTNVVTTTLYAIWKVWKEKNNGSNQNVSLNVP